MIRKAVIPAAGYGTRFLPATKVVPKELLPVVNRPAIEWVVEELVSSGIEEIIFVIGPGKESIVAHFTRGGPLEEVLRSKGKLGVLSRLSRLIEKVTFRAAYQQEARGLGHAVLSAREMVDDGPFAVVLPDDLVISDVPCLKQLVEIHRKKRLSVVALQEVPASDVEKYGIVAGRGMEKGGAFRVERVVEKPKPAKAASRWAIIGRYILDPAVFSYLERVKPGAVGEIQLTDALAALAEREGLVGYPFDGTRMDAGQPPGFLEANLRYALLDPAMKRSLRPILEKLTGKTPASF